MIILSLLISPWAFFSSALTDGLSREFEWQQVSLSLQDSSQYSGRSQQCYTVWIVSTRPPTSKSSNPFNNPLVTVLKAPITIGIIITFMIHSFFNCPARSRYLSFFSLSFSFILWSAGTTKFTILQVLFFVVDYNKVWSSGQDLVILLYVSPIGVCAYHSLGQVLGCAYTICSYGQISVSCTSPSGSPCPTSCL